MPQVIPHKSLSDTRLLQIIAGALVNPLTGEIFPIPATSVPWGSITGSIPAQSDLQAALDTKQPIDGDLTAISAITGVTAVGMYYRKQDDPPLWSRVVMGNNMQFNLETGVLNTKLFFTGAGAAEDTAAPVAGVLDLTGLDGSFFDVTGNDTITEILLQDGRKVSLRFTGTPTLVVSAGLITLGGEDIVVPAGGGLSQVIGGAGGVVTTIQSFQDSNNYSRQTFNNIYMLSAANIGFAPTGGAAFDVGRFDPSSGDGSFWRFGKGANPTLIKNEDEAIQANFRLTVLSASQIYLYPDASGLFPVIENLSVLHPRFLGNLLTTDRDYSLPNQSGTFSLIDGTETLTNKDIDDVDLIGAVNLTGTITPPGLTADVNDYAPAGFAGCSVVRVQTDGASGVFSITGLAGGIDGAIKIFHNVDLAGGIVNFPNDDPASSAGNRFLSDIPIRLPANSIGIFQYDGISLAWRATFVPPPFDGIVYWGNLNGTLADQADLQAELDAKLALAGGTMTGQLIPRTGGTAALSAPIKLVSGALMTAAVAGCLEFLTDVLYFTKTTGATRTSIATCPSAGPITFAGPTAARIITVPNAACTMARTDAKNDTTGTAAADSAAAGKLGEYVESLIAIGAATALTTATAKNITSISLTAGDWDVTGTVSFTTSAATFSALHGGISATTATLPTDGSEVYSGLTGTLLSSTDSVNPSRKRINVNVTTTVYLVAYAAFSAGSVSAFGQINARRIR